MIAVAAQWALCSPPCPGPCAALSVCPCFLRLVRGLVHICQGAVGLFFTFWSMHAWLFLSPLPCPELVFGSTGCASDAMTS